MIDFVRIEYKDKSIIEPFVRDEDNFSEMRTSFEYHSGEILYPYKVSLSGMDVIINEKSAYLKNSLHKFYNQLRTNYAQNYNDFDYSALCETVDYLNRCLPELENAELTQLEFGLNVKLDVPAEDIIRKNIVLHKYKIHSHNEKFNGKGEYKQFNHTNYYVKVYDKAKQYKRHENILRFEIKFRNKKDFNKLGIYNINDLKSKMLLQKLLDYLLMRFDEVCIVDTINAQSKITAKQKSQLESYLSYNFWEFDRSKRNQKSKEIKAFQSLLERNDLLKTKKLLRDKLLSKFTELLNK